MRWQHVLQVDLNAQVNSIAYELIDSASLAAYEFAQETFHHNLDRFLAVIFLKHPTINFSQLSKISNHLIFLPFINNLPTIFSFGSVLNLGSLSRSTTVATS